ncbi:hypothetical protein BDA96_03G220900 [Sorghum bicolor]|uniref:Uncharacterized protein n=1 Tax=Sorghum bicolor TaxID=4558 RepID=A0A921UNH8_SORBI|nr:hypothetical protein BDA96_03G220900 [Sorghum bicolor]
MYTSIFPREISAPDGACMLLTGMRYELRPNALVPIIQSQMLT